MDVWLLPIEGFPNGFADYLELTFSKDLGIRVRTTVHVGTSPRMFDASRQMIAEFTRDELATVLSRLFNTTPRTAYIVLTPHDLNSSSGGTRFLFATHFHDTKISIVSLARLRDSFFGMKDRPEVTKLRLYKMVKKAIGIQYFGHRRSSDLRSVLYSPIMSLEDLDASGTEF